MKAIVYTSKTGSTERYAQMLSKATGVPAYPAKEASKRLPRGSEVFYMGWLRAGSVSGLAGAMERYTIRGAAIVGISPAGNGDLWTEAKINGGFSDSGARLFYLRGGYAPDKLGRVDRLLMRFMANAVIKKIQAKGDAATEEERDMMGVFQNGGDLVQEEALADIVEWFRSGPHDGVLKATPTLDI